MQGSVELLPTLLNDMLSFSLSNCKVRCFTCFIPLLSILLLYNLISIICKCYGYASISLGIAFLLGC